MIQAYLQGDQILSVVGQEPENGLHAYGSAYKGKGKLLYFVGLVWDRNLLCMLKHEIGMKVKVPMHRNDGRDVVGGIGHIEVEGKVIEPEGLDRNDLYNSVNLNARIYGAAGLIRSGDYSAKVRKIVTEGPELNEERLCESIGLSHMDRKRLIKMMEKDTHETMTRFFMEAPNIAKKMFERVKAEKNWDIAYT